MLEPAGCYPAARNAYKRNDWIVTDPMPRLFMVSRPSLVAACLFLASTLAALPTSSATGQTLTWQQCLERAIASNPELRAATQDLQAAEFRVRGAGAGYLPELSANARYTDSSTSGNSSSTFTGSDEPTRSAGLEAKQNIFAGFRDQASVERAQANRANIDANLQLIKSRVSADLKSAFAALRYAQDAIVVANDIIRRREENLRLVELRFEGGRENKGSYLLSKAQVQQARFELLQANEAVLVAQRRLAKAIAFEQPEMLQVVGQPAISDPPTTVDLRALLQQVPAHRQAVANVDVASADIRLARSGLLPSLDLTASTNNVKPDSEPSERRDTVGVQLSIPIFSGLRDYYATESATATHAASVDTLADTDRQLLTQLQQTWSDFIQAVQLVEVNRSFLEAQRVRAEIARNRYNNGLMSFEDWDLIENDLITRQRTMLLTERDRVTAEAAFEQAQGIGAIP